MEPSPNDVGTDVDLPDANSSNGDDFRQSQEQKQPSFPSVNNVKNTFKAADNINRSQLEKNKRRIKNL